MVRWLAGFNSTQMGRCLFKFDFGFSRLATCRQWWEEASKWRARSDTASIQLQSLQLMSVPSAYTCISEGSLLHWMLAKTMLQYLSR